MVAVLVIVSAYPLYRVVRQEFIPTDVDEAEFQLQVTAPEGTSTAAMDDILRAIDRDVRRIPGVETVLSTTGGGNLALVNTGSAYVRIAPHEERIFSLQRLFVGLVTPRSAGCIPRQLQSARRHEADPGHTPQVPRSPHGRP